MSKLFIVIIVLSLFTGCEDFFDKDIEYRVTGTAGSVSLTYKNEDGGTEQQSGIQPPWTHSFTAAEGDFLYISAQNQTATGTVTASIYVDGDLWKTASSEGAYVIATASGGL